MVALRLVCLVDFVFTSVFLLFDLKPRIALLGSCVCVLLCSTPNHSNSTPVFNFVPKHPKSNSTVCTQNQRIWNISLKTPQCQELSVIVTRGWGDRTLCRLACTPSSSPAACMRAVSLASSSACPPSMGIPPAAMLLAGAGAACGSGS